VFAPFGLQRRMLLGLFFPMAGLAETGAVRWPGRAWKKALAYVIFVLPSNLVVMAATLGGALAREPELVMTSREGRVRLDCRSRRRVSLVLAGGRSNRLRRTPT
jgi:hypothetical protein